MANYAWIGPIIIKRVRDAIVLNIRRQFASDPTYPYVQNLTLTATTGIVTVTNGSNVVSGNGTTFTMPAPGLQPNNIIQFSSQPSVSYYIQSVSSNTSLTLTTEYTGGTDASAMLSVGSNATVNFDCSGITINDATAQDYYSLPSITVMTASGEEHRFLQEDFFEEFEDANGNMSERRGAPMDITVTVEATALDVITRDQLVDRLYEKFKVITTDLANNGIGILRTSILPDRRKYENDRWFYTSGVTMHLYAEWLDEDITALNSTMTGFKGEISTPGGIHQGFDLQ